MKVDRLHDISKCKVLIYGDFMVDKYIMGNVKRISPEAPVPILEVTKKNSKLGGAGNVVNNIIALGASTRVLGCVGDDADGMWIIERLNKRSADTAFMQMDSDVMTIVKTRVVSKKQQYIRLDEERIQDIPDTYEAYVRENIEEILKDISVIIISDYGKGAVTKQIAGFLIDKANERNIPVVVDPKGSDYSKYRGATVCTPNTNELRVVTGITSEEETAITEAGFALRDEVSLKYLMLTRSEKGISVFEDEKKTDYPAVEKDVVDVTGAGDTVVSVVALGLAVGYDIGECSKLANLAASVVCSKFGAATLSMNELLECILYTGEFKNIDAEVAVFIAENLREKGKKVVFTNGCFDLVHAGHVSSFNQAKNMGDVLIVAVNSDASVKRLKGDKRPIVTEDNRIAMLCALECIDYVILMEDDNPIRLIEAIKPDITVKGKDWEDKYLPEREVVEAYGGEVRFIELEKGLSTTNIINKIVEVNK